MLNDLDTIIGSVQQAREEGHTVELDSEYCGGSGGSYRFFFVPEGYRVEDEFGNELYLFSSDTFLMGFEVYPWSVAEHGYTVYEFIAEHHTLDEIIGEWEDLIDMNC